MQDDLLSVAGMNAACAARCTTGQLRGKSAAKLRRCLLLLACGGTFVATTCNAQQQTPGPWADINSQVDETNVNVGLSLEGVDVTVLVGQVEIPVQSITGGNWNNPLDWNNVIVYYNDVQTVLDLANGELFTTNLNTLSTNLTFNQFMNQGPTQGGVDFPVPDPIPVLGETVHVNLGTNVIYDVNVVNDIALNQNAVLNSLSIGSGGNLDVNDQYSLSVGEGPIVNSGTISKTLGTGTFYFGQPVENNGAITVSSGTLWLTPTTTGLLEADPGGTMAIDNAALTGGAMTGGGIFSIVGGGSGFSSSTTLSNVNVHDTTLNIPGENNNLTAWGTWNNVTVTPQANSSLQTASNQTLTLSGNSKLNLQGGVVSGQLVNGGSSIIDGYGYENAGLTNNGTISADAGSKILYVEANITNAGIMEATNSATLNLTNANLSNLAAGVLTMGTYQVNANSTMNINGSIVSNAATIILNGGNTTFAALSPITANTGSFQLLNGASFAAVGNFSNSGNVLIDGGSTLQINGALTNTTSGTIAMDPSLLQVTGNFSTNGTLNIGLGGAGSGQYDQINVDGRAILGGTLQISLMNNFAVQKGDTFNILVAQAGVTGNFTDSTLTSGPDLFYVNYLPNTVTLTTVATPDPNSILTLAAGLGGIVLLGRIRRRDCRAGPQMSAVPYGKFLVRA